MTEIKLGDKVKCIHTGFTGIALSRTEFFNGCIQYGVAAKCNKDGKMLDEVGIDEQSLVVIEPKKKPKQEEESNGGATRLAPKMRGG